ncbi:MAG: glycosyltransferase family 4 protein [Methanoregula sp.]|nr:glycosyltransferase family 4 protein [Methanoregula sp.]
MKLLICTSEYFPHGSGIANVVFNVVEQLKKQGVECTVCSPTGPDITLGNKQFIEKFGFLGLIYYWHQVSHFFKHTDYDVVWLQNPYFIYHNPFHRCLITMHSTYFGLSHHNVGNTRFLQVYYKIISAIEEFSLAQLSKKTVFTGVGQPVCEELEKMGIEKERITYVPNGVDVQSFNPALDKTILRKKIGVPNNNIILLSVGRLTPQKGTQTLIEVFSLLEKSLGNLTLCIAGKGELLDSAKILVKKNGLQKVIFLGYVDERDLPALYAGSDYYIINSIYEGGMPPLTLSEAMASGLPCIVSDIPNFSIVNDAGCGLIVNFGNIDHAAKEILEYLSREHQDHAKNARNYTIQFLDWEIISKEYLKIFERLIMQ